MFIGYFYMARGRGATRRARRKVITNHGAICDWARISGAVVAQETQEHTTKRFVSFLHFGRVSL